MHDNGMARKGADITTTDCDDDGSIACVRDTFHEVADTGKSLHLGPEKPHCYG